MITAVRGIGNIYHVCKLFRKSSFFKSDAMKYTVIQATMNMVIRTMTHTVIHT